MDDSNSDMATPISQNTSSTHTRTISLQITGPPISRDSSGDPHEILERAKRLLAEVDSDISLLQSERQEAIQVMSAQRRLLNAMCTIQRLHDDILFAIFNLIVQDYAIGLRNTGNVRDLWALAGVCKRWRKVCLGEPRLWRYISLKPDNFRDHTCDTDERDPASVLRTFRQLELSRDLPLIVDGTGLCDCPSQASRFRAVSAHCHRWEVANLGYNFMLDGDIPPSWPDLFRSSFIPNANLAKLTTLDWDVKLSQGTLSLPFPDVVSLPSLKSLSVSNFLKSIPDRTSLPLEQLSRLSIESYEGDPQDLLKALSSCKSLLYLKITIPCCSQHHPPSPEIVTMLPNLVELDHGVGLLATNSLYLARSLHVPSLRRATFRTFRGEESLDTVAALLKRSSCHSSLISLHLSIHWHMDSGDRDGLVKVLQLCPEIKTFSLGHLFLGYQTTPTLNNFAEALILSNSQEKPLCPQLQKLWLNGVNVDPAILIQVIDSRRGVEGRKSRFQSLNWTLPQVFRSDEDKKAVENCKELFKQKYGSSGLRYHISLHQARRKR